MVLACLALGLLALGVADGPRLAMSGEGPGEGRAVPDPSWRLSFDEDFRRFDANAGPLQNGLLQNGGHQSERWATRFLWGDRFITTSGERQIYVDRDFAGFNPFRKAADGGLIITADRAPVELRPRLSGRRYMSGLLTTHPFFAQTYGYFEIRARLPRGRGLWPAFWLLPVTGRWPPEIDVFEVLGHDTRTLHVSFHTAAAGADRHSGAAVAVPDLSRDFHLFGLLWTRDELTWFFDGRPVRRAPTPADMHAPMYLLVNLAVGGKWPGNPDPSTPFPSELHVDHIRAFALPEP